MAGGKLEAAHPLSSTQLYRINQRILRYQQSPSATGEHLSCATATRNDDDIGDAAAAAQGSPVSRAWRARRRKENETARSQARAAIQSWRFTSSGG